MINNNLITELERKTDKIKKAMADIENYIVDRQNEDSLVTTNLKVYDISYMVYHAKYEDSNSLFGSYVDMEYQVYQDILRENYPDVEEEYLGRTSSFYYDIDKIIYNYFFNRNQDIAADFNSLIYFLEDYTAIQFDLEEILLFDYSNKEKIKELQEGYNIDIIIEELEDCIIELQYLKETFKKINKVYEYLNDYKKNQCKYFLDDYKSSKEDLYIDNYIRAKEDLEELLKLNIANDYINTLTTNGDSLITLINNIDVYSCKDNKECIQTFLTLEKAYHDLNKINENSYYNTKILNIDKKTINTIKALTEDEKRRIEILEKLI